MFINCEFNHQPIVTDAQPPAYNSSNHFAPLGVEGFTSQEDQEMISRIEKQLKRRFAIGSQVSEHSIVQDFTKQVSMSGSCCFTMVKISTLPK